MRDFNAEVGTGNVGETAVVHFGISRRNARGDQVLAITGRNMLSDMNTLTEGREEVVL